MQDFMVRQEDKVCQYKKKINRGKDQNIVLSFRKFPGFTDDILASLPISLAFVSMGKEGII